MSKRAELRRLVREHPDWTNAQYAKALGQPAHTVRGALSAMGLSRKPKSPPLPPLKEKPKPKPKPQRPPHFVASKCSSTRYGYVKLI